MAEKIVPAQPIITEKDLRPPTATERRKGLKAIKALGLLQGNTPVNYHDLLNELIDVKGAIRLSQEAVSRATDGIVGNVYKDEQIDVQELLAAAEGVLGMALRALDQAYEHIDTPAICDAWPTPAAEVSNV